MAADSMLADPPQGNKHSRRGISPPRPGDLPACFEVNDEAVSFVCRRALHDDPWMLVGRSAFSCAGVLRGRRRIPVRGAPTTGPAPVPDPAERQILTDVVQLTRGFDKAGEGYFSRDMNWVIFQASPPGEKNYQMYVARWRCRRGVVPHRPAGADLTAKLAEHLRLLRTGRPVAHLCLDRRQGGSERADVRLSAAGRELPVGLPQGYGDLSGEELGPAADRLGLPGRSRQARESSDQQRRLRRRGRLLAGREVDRLHLLPHRRLGDLGDAVGRVNPVQITHAKGYDGGPFFSPDGKRLVYRSDRKGNDLLQIFVADLAFDGQGDITGVKAEHQLTNDDNVNWGPYWYPDGQHLIFATSRHGIRIMSCTPSATTARTRRGSRTATASTACRSSPRTGTT